MRAILAYHSIDRSGSVISIDPPSFRSHLRALSEGRVRVVALSEIVDVPAEEHAVTLTFDDGFANFETEALPELREHGFPATLFAVSGHAGRTNRWGGVIEDGIPDLPLLNWDGLARVAEEGVEIGAHTVTHPWMPALQPEQVREELERSAEALRRETGQAVRSFAYPYGGISEAVVDHTRDCFDRACTTELRVLGNREDPCLLPRLDAYYFREADAFDGWGGAAFRLRLRMRAEGRRLRSLLLPHGGRTRHRAAAAVAGGRS